MKKVDKEIKKVFISYSWTTEEHKRWVRELAENLLANGVDVVLDVWNLKPGQEKYAFMESMVTSKEIDKVLIICDRGYKEKADDRTGGVGTETQILTPKIYGDVSQEKFIPIVSERNEETNEEYVPTFIESRVYIDLSSPSIFDENYEQLLRTIYEAPSLTKPKIGATPTWLFEEPLEHFSTSRIVTQMEKIIDVHPDRIKYLILQFKDEFLNGLNKIELQELDGEKPNDDVLMMMIDKSLLLKNDYAKAIGYYLQVENQNVDIFVEFFEELVDHIYSFEKGGYYQTQFDQYKFLVHELFVVTMMTILKYGHINLFSKLINHDYFFRKNRNQATDFVDFREYVQILDDRNTRLGLNKVSLHADILKNRYSEREFEEFIDVELLLYYISKVHPNIKGDYNLWFPATYLYKDMFNPKPIKLLNKLKSKSFFEENWSFLGINDKAKLQDEIRKCKGETGYTGGGRRIIPGIDMSIKADELCSRP
ncbi:TIR domain-containing protein [Listeria rocourtiae]|uniref:SEFIR domain-containing protein n=1 Tax=Listeria rocourtiae TaxID=647910 RepID=UPI001623AC4D|nr:SEFIR domain-containing protein [Listeria rocourtiae]MBC1433765.1 TIR domain-containing protein [Listeria rocourtiae]